VDLLNKILELDTIYEGDGQQQGRFETNKPNEAIKEIVRRMFPGVNAQIPISENLQLNLGPNLKEISAGGQFDVGGGQLSIGGGMSGDDKAFGIGFRKQFSEGGLSAEVLKEKLPKYFNKTGARKLLGVNTIRKILNLYQKEKIGREAIAKVLAEAGNPVPATTIGRLLEDAKAAKIIKQIPYKEMKTNIDKRITPVGEKRKILEVIRPVTDFDRKNPNINAPKNSTHKVVYYIPENPETSVIPKKFQGVQYYNSLETAKNALKEKQNLNINQLKYKPQDNAVKSIHRIALKDPDDITDVKELAKMIYGNDNLKNLQNISNDLIRYQQFLLGFKDIKGIDVPTKELLSDILSSFPAENEYGQFASGAIRNAKLEIRDKLLKTKGTKLFNLRNNVLKLIDTNALNLDEVMGVSATFEKAPGYTELGQVIDKNINRKKGTDIDKPFVKLFEKVMDGDPNPTITYKGEKINVQEFNKLSTDFGIKNKIKTPTILLKPGESLDASKFIDNFKDLSPEAQKNIQAIAKKGIVLPSKAEPISKILAGLSNNPACAVFAGKRGKFQPGGSPNANLDDCVKGGIDAINSGKVPKEKARDFVKILKGGGTALRNLAKYGVLPEAVFFTADSFIRLGLGDTFKEAGLRASDYILPGDQTKLADVSKVSRIFGDKTGEIVSRSIDYRNQMNRINSLETQKQNLEALNVPSDFSYTGDLTPDIKNIDASIAQSKKDLENKFYMPLEQRLFADRKFNEAYDASMAQSGTIKTLGKLREISDSMDFDDSSGLQSDTQAPTPLKLDTAMFPSFKKDMLDATEVGNLSEEDIRRYFESIGKSPDKFLETRESFKNLKKLPLSSLAQIYGDEQIYGAQGASALGEPLANGGIAGLSGGDKSGPPPERGPDSQGLRSLMKRGINL